ncbi:hypothetical protein C4E44_31185, partial [Pseudomonas sp. MWU12-2312b]
MSRACFWRWEIVRFKLRENSPFHVIYVGRKAQREFAKVLMGADSAASDAPLKSDPSSQAVLVSEMPTPGALCVPQYLSAVVPLNRTIKEKTTKKKKKKKK